MADHVVSLPPDVVQAAASSKREAVSLLAYVTAYATPGRFALRDLEYSLSVRFASIPALSLSDMQTWLGELGVATVDLGNEIAQTQQGMPDALRGLLHSQNDQGMIQMLHLADASQLIDASGLHPISTPVPCFALRVGYMDTDPYGYYYLSLPGYDLSQSRLAWGSVVAARPDGGIAVAAPKPALDIDAATTALHIIEQSLVAANQSLATANNAHATLRDALGFPA